MSYTNTLYINHGFVSLDAIDTVRAIEISYSGDITIENKMPQGNLVQKGKDKIIVLNLTGEQSFDNIFNYIGKINITSCIIVDN